MEEVIIHKVKLNGNLVFPIGLGTWNIGDDAREETREIEALQAGLEAGAQVIDTAEMYGNGRSESLIGKAIQG